MQIVIEKDKNLQQETLKRKKKMLKEFSKKPKIKLFKNNEGYDQIVAQVGIPFSALCEHHEVSFEGEAIVAYIPNKYYTGLSKFGRVVEYFLNPTVKTIQERATKQILDTLVEALQPKGLMVILKARHNCICYRGVKKPSDTITSAVYGAFKDNVVTRQELLSLVKL